MGKLISIIENSDIGILRFCLNVFCEQESDGLAWQLVERFGSVEGIFSATHDEIASVDGVTERMAMFFTAVRPLQRQAQLRAITGVKLDSPHDCAGYAAVYFMGEHAPSEVCVCLDQNNSVICVEQPGKDFAREIASIACRSDANRIALLRFEPRLKRKRVLPSLERQRQLIKIARLMDTIGVELVDYVEYAQGCCFSLRGALRGDVGVYRVKNADPQSYPSWNNAVQALNAYYAASVAYAKARRIK